jgi:3-phenylpropionate/trans-cinnamate dioxygenase ferredoxin reductase component
MNVNIWDATDTIQALVRGGRTVDPGRLADPGVSLDELGDPGVSLDELGGD